MTDRTEFSRWNFFFPRRRQRLKEKKSAQLFFFPRGLEKKWRGNMSDFLHLAADFLGDLSRLRPSRRPVPQSKTFLFQASCNKRATSGGGGVWRAVGKSLLEREREREREKRTKKTVANALKFGEKPSTKSIPKEGSLRFCSELAIPNKKSKRNPVNRELKNRHPALNNWVKSNW